MFLAAVITRFWGLGFRALHHDESLHAHYALKLSQGLGYRHDPMMHGPFQFFLNALAFLGLGANDFTARVPAALFGVFLVMLPWLLLRRWLTNVGGIVASFLILISPSIMFYSRFMRNDIYVLVFSVACVFFLCRYLESQKTRWLYWFFASLSLLYATKEIAFIFSIILFVFLVLLVLIQSRKRTEPLLQTPAFDLIVCMVCILLPLATALFAAFLTSAGLPFQLAQGSPIATVYGTTLLLIFTVVSICIASITGRLEIFLKLALIFYGPFLLLHTSFFFNLGGLWSGLIGSLDYWITQHSIHRGGQPWYYYLMLLTLYEYFVLILLAIAVVFWILDKRCKVPVGRAFARPTAILHLNQVQHNKGFFWILVWWCLASFVAFTIAGERMPWLVVHIVFPAILLAGLGIGKWWPALRSKKAKIVLISIGFILSIATVHDAYRASFINGHKANEMLVYNTVTNDVKRVIAMLDKRRRVGYTADVSWPFMWYLRDFKDALYVVDIDKEIPNIDALILSKKEFSSIKKSVTAYEIHDFKLRWSFPPDANVPPRYIDFFNPFLGKKQVWDYLTKRKLPTPPITYDFKLLLRKT